MDLALRPPTAADLEEIGAGWEKAVPHDEFGNWWRQDSDLVLPAPKVGTAAVATLGPAIVGFVSAINRTLCAIYVQEDCRRQGIGTALLDRVFSHGKKKKWKKIAVTSPHPWMGAVAGLDVRYEGAVRFLQERGFQQGDTINDVEADFADSEAASARRPLAKSCSVAEYTPEALEEMIIFVKKLKLKAWVWPDWIEQYRRTDPKRVRMIARVDDQLVGCVDALISPNGTGGINYISVLHQYRHRGIGSALLRHAARLLEQRGATSMFAGHVPRPFYEYNGWRLQRQYIGMETNLG